MGLSEARKEKLERRASQPNCPRCGSKTSLQTNTERKRDSASYWCSHCKEYVLGHLSTPQRGHSEADVKALLALHDYSKARPQRYIPEYWNPRGRNCEVCGAKPSNDIKIGDHHIISRAKGGKKEPDNMIRLCDSCHDWYEMYASEARSRIDFIALVRMRYPSPKEHERVVITPASKPTSTSCRLHGNWHEWVYGGVNAPSWGCNCRS